VLSTDVACIRIEPPAAALTCVGDGGDRGHRGRSCRPAARVSVDMGRFVLFVGGLHLLIAVGVAVFAGILARLVWRRADGIVLEGSEL
jgi:hypothetical protein